ncbi:hypothetical protein GCM10007866_10960 [Gluconobacter albidus]|uniref:Uncharacterized protein n=1 Tax=Gluconobacter albidus TaxID=318683 RepID=A0ABQ5X173_9PROT|nr:hypothetical protein AA3250_0815 [Gluconobacter albidus NBRC 3250]GLQ68645.1 hypothetical protein GCM10007866_10960 [Gluconobacter albidus]
MFGGEAVIRGEDHAVQILSELAELGGGELGLASEITAAMQVQEDRAWRCGVLARADAQEADGGRGVRGGNGQPFKDDGIVFSLKERLSGGLFQPVAEGGEGVGREIDGGDLFKEREEFREDEGPGVHECHLALGRQENHLYAQWSDGLKAKICSSRHKVAATFNARESSC